MKNRKMLVAVGAAALTLVAVGLLFGREKASPVDAASSPRQNGNQALSTGCGEAAASTGAAVASAGGASVQTNAVASIPAKQTPTARGTLPYVLTGKGAFDKTLRLAAEALGAKTVAPRGRRTLLVEATPEVRARLKADARFEDVAEFLPAEKIQPELAALVAKGEKTVEVSIVSLDAADREAVVAALTAAGGEMLKGCINEGDMIRATIPADSVATLAARGEVRWMETFVRPKFTNDLAVNGVMMNVRTVWDPHGLTGAGQKISTSDTGIDSGNPETLHEDLRNRVKDMQVVSGCLTTDSNGHGTHTAGSIVGDGTKSDGKIKGTAYGADLYAWFCCGTDGYVYTPSKMKDLYLNGGAWTASVHSASWGAAVSGQYISACTQHDKFVWENPEFLPVFAAGNEGCNGNGTVVYSQSISSPGSAKNVLTVGATQSTRHGFDGGWGNGNPEKTVVFSSRGPCCDGRIKPDVAAPGTGILSTRSHGVNYSYGIYDEFYAYDSGTSMATPLTAGSVALVRQWLIRDMGFAEEDGRRPTAALMKAVVMGGAKGAAVPNNDQGWGRVDIGESLFPSGRAVKLLDRIPFAAGYVTNIVIETTNAAPLDVQLVWVDYPGDASGGQSVPKLVNDLDLTVESIEGGLLFGNGGSEPDALNNAESVRIASATATKYVITVDCKTILHDHTEGGAAALYIRGAFDPSATPTMPEVVRLRKAGTLHMSLDDALKAVAEEDETVEILQRADFRSSVTLANGCTIVATNDDALASLVTRRNGATLTVQDATLTVTNFAFSGDASEPFLTVKAGATLRVAGKVGLGTVATEDATGFDLCGAFEPIGGGVSVDFPGGCGQGDVFGTYSCDYQTASGTASRIYNPHDLDLGGVAVADAGKLKWGIVTVPLADANCILVNEDGTAGYRTFAAMMRMALQKDSAVEIVRDVTHTNTLTLAHNLAISSQNGAILSFGKDAGFVIPGGTQLLITNATVSGTGDQGNAVDSQKNVGFSVTGGELILEDGAVLSGFSSRYATHKDTANYGGTVVVNPGTFTMRSGSRIENCSSHNEGGAVWLGGKDAMANLLGGAITGCSASAGGAVYAWGNASTGSTVNVAGDFVATNNTMGSVEKLSTGNLFLMRMAPLKLAGELTGAIGVSFGKKPGLADLNATNVSFVAIGLGLSEAETTSSAACFANDLDANLVGSYTDGKIVWTERPNDDGQCDVSEARYSVVIDEGGANEEWRYYEWIEDAFDHIDADATVYCAEGDWLGRDIEIRHAVRLVSFMPEHLGKQTIQRLDDAMVKIVKGGSLTLENIRFSGLSNYTDWYPYYYENTSSNGLFSVDGGSLTLEEGAVVGYVVGSASRASNAITVFNGGTVTMKSGSTVTECDNGYMDDYETSCGGGILLDHATGRFEGGAIYNCKAYRAGGLYVANGSTAYVSGDLYLGCNYGYKREFAGDADTSDNIVVSKNSKLVLAGPLASVDPESEDPEDPDPGYIGVNEGMSSDSNCFATVEWEWTDFEELQESAAQFAHDKRKSPDPVYYPEWDYWDYTVYGTAVTNWNEKTERWDARLVWEDSLSLANGITIDGETYRGAIPAGLTVATPKAFSVTPMAGANGKQVLQLDGGVEGCWYTVYSTTDLSLPFAKEASVQLKPGETFEYEIDQSKTSKFYKVVAEEGLK